MFARTCIPYEIEEVFWNGGARDESTSVTCSGFGMHSHDDNDDESVTTPTKRQHVRYETIALPFWNYVLFNSVPSMPE